MNDQPETRSIELSESEARQEGMLLTQDIMEDLLSRADVTAVYGEPVRQGETRVIPTAEVLAIAGFGIGSGGGRQGSGSGGGGGGRAFSRPVAVIIVRPEGVEVKPVLDLTKIALAGLTAIGFMISTVAKMRRADIERT